MKKHRLKSFIAFTLASTSLYANINGLVYKDFDLNGAKNGGDAVVSGVAISALCDDGLTYNAITDVDGLYTLTGFPAGSKCRVEADPSNAGVGSGPNADGSAPLVDIVTDGSVHNISVGSSATYCQANPDVVMAALPGYYDGSGGRQSPTGLGTIFKVPTPDIGSFNANGTIAAKRTTLTISNDTGAIWGMAWKKGTQDLFAAANLKRYVPLKGNAGEIYKIDTTAANAVSLFITVPNATSAAADTVIAARTYGQNEDTDIMDYIGRQGLGDVDINEDETKLYTINMNTKELVVIDIATASIVQTVAIPNPYGASCPSADVRPWAVKARGSDIYIGSICDSEVENNVGASVQKYNGAIIQEIARTNTLLYLKPKGYNPRNESNGGYNYKNWATYGHQPMLTDIEFTNEGDLVLGYTNRGAYSRVTSLNGDIRKMCLNVNGTYTDENTLVAPTACTSHVVNYGTAEDYYEFYTGDYFGGDLGKTGHPESASGSLAMAPGAPNIIVGMIDGTDWYQPGAIGLYSNTTGDKIGAQAVINRDKVSDGGEREPYGSKAGGMGDVELLCDPAPIEIGNYVWIDGNLDGIQDPNEPGIPNINVVLSCTGTDIGTATTDANGHYYFGGINNANLTAPNTIVSDKNCQLRLAQADVNNKPPTIQDPNGNNEDQHDNDAVASGADNVINFTTTVSNDHSLDFGITPTVGCVEGQLYDDVDNSGTHEIAEQVASDVALKVTDSFGGVHILSTDASGNYQFVGIPAGAATIEVDVTDTDIPEGSIWYNSTFNVNILESTPGTCLVQDARLHIPAPVAQDPKDVATCANPTSITWEGATVSSASVWHDMGSNNALGSAKTFTTVGGTTVNANMYITNPDNELNNPEAGTYDGANTSGTDGVFNAPYLTLYLGDQAAPGNGTYNDIANCAANGYDLVAGEKIELMVEFDQEVILDNWRIRDVDSGDDRSGTANWNWQDGIEVQAFDANNNPIDIESKIGSAGAGLIKDANNIVHTDPATYNGGNVATGGGTSANSSDGHIVLTSNFVPVKKLIITHVAGPDVPCQTRSALAMAGLAVCAPLHISGTVYNDDDGSKPLATCDTSDNVVDGTPINSVEGNPLNACLIDMTSTVLDTQVLDVNGQYDFDRYLHPNTGYKVIITEANCTIGNNAPSATLSQGWEYEGEISDPTTVPATLDATVDGMVNVNLVTSSIVNIDFGINKKPTSIDYTRPAELNPIGTTQVDFDATGAAVLADFVSDNEEIVPSRIKITQVSATGGIIYYANNPLVVGTIIDNPVISDFTIDPDDGDVALSFSYVSMDKACQESDGSIFRASFTVPQVSGTLFLDTVRNDVVDGNTTPNSCDNATALYANLIDTSTQLVVASSPLDTDGTYSFKYSDGVRRNTNYEILISQISANTGDVAPSTLLPGGCMFADGENINSINPAGTDGSPDGNISVSVATTDVTLIDFSITPAVKIGNLVWFENDNDGNSTTGSVAYLENITVSAVSSTSGRVFTAITDVNGSYAIMVPVNDTYVVSLATPNNKIPTLGSIGNDDVPADNSENNTSHDPQGTTVDIGIVDNLTLDFGFVVAPNPTPTPTPTPTPVPAPVAPTSPVAPVVNVVGNGNSTLDVLGSGDQLISFTQPLHGTVTRDDHGTPDDTTDDTLVYVANKGYSGTDSFTYTVIDSDGNTVTKTTSLSVKAKKSSNGSALNTLSTMLLMILTGLIGLYYIRREELTSK